MRSLNFANEQNAHFHTEAVVQIQDKKLEHIFRHPAVSPIPHRRDNSCYVRRGKRDSKGPRPKSPNISFRVSSTLVSAREMITGARSEITEDLSKSLTGKSTRHLDSSTVTFPLLYRCAQMRLSRAAKGEVK